jgi:hypothetical protein
MRCYVESSSEPAHQPSVRRTKAPYTPTHTWPHYGVVMRAMCPSSVRPEGARSTEPAQDGGAVEPDAEPRHEQTVEAGPTPGARTAFRE